MCFNGKMCMLIMKCEKKREITEMELTNQERIRTLKEKENNNYLGVLEADIIKQAEMKEKKKETSTLNEQENISKPSSATEISSKG